MYEELDEIREWSFGLASRLRNSLLLEFSGIECRGDERLDSSEVEIIGFSLALPTMEDAACVHDARERRIEILGASIIEQFENCLAEFAIAETEHLWLLLRHFYILSCKMNLLILYY